MAIGVDGVIQVLPRDGDHLVFVTTTRDGDFIIAYATTGAGSSKADESYGET